MEEQEEKTEEDKRQEKVQPDQKKEKENVKAYVPPIPFPQRLKKHKLDKQFENFLSVFKQLHINIPFADALAQIPVYAKFLKEIMSNKRKLEEYETVALTEECSALIQNKLPPKLKDPGSFSIPCTIGNVEFSKALCDLGASVSLMPLSVSKKLGLKEIKPTTVTLQLADRSVKHPVGILENVLMKVGKFYIPVDFIVLEMEEDVEIPLLLGRPFLATAGAHIDVRNGKLTLKVGEEEETFNVLKKINSCHISDSCCKVEVMNKLPKEDLSREKQKKFLEVYMNHDLLMRNDYVKKANTAPKKNAKPKWPFQRKIERSEQNAFWKMKSFKNKNWIRSYNDENFELSNVSMEPT